MPTGVYKHNPVGYWRGKKRGKPSKEHIEKIRSACKKVGVGKWMAGRKLSQKTKEKISLSNKKNYANGNRVSVFKYFVAEKNHRWVEDRNKLQKYNDDNKDRSGGFGKRRSNVFVRTRARRKCNKQKGILESNTGRPKAYSFKEIYQCS